MKYMYMKTRLETFSMFFAICLVLSAHGCRVCCMQRQTECKHSKYNVGFSSPRENIYVLNVV